MKNSLSSEVEKIKKEVAKTIIGQEEVINSFIIAIIANGHILIEGAPGLAKTTIVKTLSTIISCKFERIQFTPDLLPGDIIGINTYDKDAGFHIEKGPVFTNLLLADEINRASSKVQSALLEAMAEREVTIGKQNIKLERPFLVFATENPIESLGTYELPQAQLDRFLFKVIIDYPTNQDESDIIEATLQIEKLQKSVNRVLTKENIIRMQEEVKRVYINEELKAYIIQIIEATRDYKKFGLKLGKFIEWGVGPRGTISIVMAAKANAYINGRNYVIDQDIKDIIHPTLRHRVLLNYEGQAKKITPDHAISEILSVIKIP